MASPSLKDLHALRERLCSPELDQGHLFVGWPTAADAYTPQQAAFLEELFAFGEHYLGGVEQYIRNGKTLLAKLDQGRIGYSRLEMPPLLFEAPCLHERSVELDQLEAFGVPLVKSTVFVLVAGGLGERLGYSGIKVGLPVETATGRCYLEHYLTWIKAIAGADAPVAIMTSSDTHTRTIALLDKLHLDMRNMRLLKQETVFCFTDSDAHIACGVDGRPFRKPHGHGDVHSLIYTATEEDPTDPGRRIPLIDAWQKKGHKYLCFFQDTNAIAVFTIPVSLAISERESLDMNFTCVPRKPKEAVGLLCRAQMNDEGDNAHPNWRTINIEYNTFADVAQALTEEGGDRAAKNSEYSPFPGSINTLILNLSSYAAKLHASKGYVPEFINPKYVDDTCRKFKKPSRVESLMQDIALLFSDRAQDRIGGTVFSRFTYQPVKNSLEEAMDKVRQGIDTYCPSTGECDFYEFTRCRLRAVGVPLYYTFDPEIILKSCIPVRLFPIITMDAISRGDGSLSDLAKVFPSPKNVNISATSTLLIEGRVVVHSLELDGSLQLVGPCELESPPLIVHNVKVSGDKWSVVSVPESADVVKDFTEVDIIRGFVVIKKACKVIDSSTKM